MDFNSFNEKVSIPVLAQAFSSLGGAVTTQYQALANELVGPLTDLLGEAIAKDKGAICHSILAAVQGKGLKVVVYQKTTLPQVIENLAEAIQDVNPALSREAGRLAVSRMMTKYDPVNFAPVRATKSVFAIDHARLAKVSTTGTATGAGLPMEEMVDVETNRMQGVKGTGGGYSVIALVCQTVSIWQSIKSFKDVALWNKTEEGLRLLAGVSGYISAFGTTAYTCLKPTVSLGLETSKAFSRFKFLGVAAGVANGLVDVWKGIESIMNKDRQLGGLYLSSAFTGSASAILLGFEFTAAWVPWVGWALLIAYVGIQYFLANWSRSKLQNWLEHCSFGKTPGSWNAATEQAELNTAMGWA